MHGRSLHRTLAIDAWSRRGSSIHRLPAGLKLAAVFAALIAVSLAASNAATAVLLGLAVTLALAARLPPAGLLLRAAIVLPFTATFALLAWWQGDPARAAALLLRAYTSALWAVLLVATTPMDALLRALARLRTPPLLLDVINYLWRYLHVIVEQAWRLRTAAETRGASRRFRVAAGSVAVLFASAHARAERIHRAMLARRAAGARP